MQKKQLIKKIIVVLSMMSIIAGTFIGIMTYSSIGFSQEFLSRWSSSFLFAILVMIPLAGVLMFIADKFIKALFPNANSIYQDIMIGIIMALSMESIMAISTTINIIGYPNFDSFSSFWLKSYLAALPFALVLSPIMTLFIKPRLERYMAK